MSDTFMRITNKDIYDKLNDFIKTNDTDHKTITGHLIKTNGRVSLNTILSKTAMGLGILALSIITGINLLNI